MAVIHKVVLTLCLKVFPYEKISLKTVEIKKNQTSIFNSERKEERE